jgi:alkylation response protein AidB-like acyl-CoA dehydrogenase
VWLSEEVAWDIVGRDPNAAISGTLAPPGRAVIVPGGYRVTGQWRFASGCHHATWHVGYAALFDGETRVLAEDGTPAFRLMLVPAAELTIIDTWQVTGMRGTGSHDVAVTDVFVPADHSYGGGAVDPPVDPRCYPGLLYRILPDLVPICLAAVPLGMTRAAIDAFIDLSHGKRRQHASGLLSEHAVVQDRVGRAEASLRAARAFVYETLRATSAAVRETGAVTAEQRTLLALAATHATATAVQVMDMLWDAAGATTIFPASPLERLFRNIHTVQHNTFIGAHQFETAGRAFLNRG